MKIGRRRWIPVALCCLPAVAIAAILLAGIVVGGASIGAVFGGPIGVGVLGLALLACPVTMGWMLWRMSAGSDHTARSNDCCIPEQQNVAQVPDAAERLSALRMRRAALEAEIAEVARSVEPEA